MKVYGVIGRKDAGKTTLVERLVAEMTARGLRVATVKHAHHDAEIDRPGRDSHRHREAGAAEVALVSPRRWAVMSELRGTPEPSLDAVLARLGPADIVLIEGYKGEAHPKIEVYREGLGAPPLAEADATVRALATDGPVAGIALPTFDRDDAKAIANFILRQTGYTTDGDRTSDATAAPDHVGLPALTNDCFGTEGEPSPPLSANPRNASAGPHGGSAMPRGVAWVPVDEALARLRGTLRPVAPATTVPLAEAAGRILAEDVRALRSNPPHANAAVDGYGFAHAANGSGPQRLPLVDGRAAAGRPFPDTVPLGAAIRILTGAMLPKGVDTVILEEETVVGDGYVAFSGPVKARANTRRAGEDVEAGAIALPAGHRLRPPDLALLTALGHADLPVRARLKVGVLSTGDEIVAQAGTPAEPHQIWDANRPMLLALAAGWGHEPVDLGAVGDDPDAIAAALDDGAARADAILVSGGASAGDEDHVSALLRARGRLVSWRIAMKPGRPLALAAWNGAAVFGLPGNPVAAFVCALVFARPALSLMAGGRWLEPEGIVVPAAFAKTKKAGRREYLRARLDVNGRAEVFPSEGSGRISGLAWATGLVELPDEAMAVEPGTPVRFLSYAALGVA